MQNYTFIFLFLDSAESEASVTDAYDLDDSSAGVDMEEEKTRAFQQYDPLTMPSLTGIPGNILIQFLAFVLFYWCLGLLLCCYLCFILELPSFAKEMIRNAVDRVWSSTPGHADESLTPLILPLYPSQYCFPEAKDIRTNLNSSTDSNRSGNNACRFNLVSGALRFIVWILQIFFLLFTVGPFSTEPLKAKQVARVRPIPSQKPMLNPKPKHPTLVVPVTPLQNKGNKH